MEQRCESCGLPILDCERLSLFQTHHEPFYICIRRLRAELELSKANAEKNCTAWENTAKHFQTENERLHAENERLHAENERLRATKADSDSVPFTDMIEQAALDAAGHS